MANTFLTHRQMGECEAYYKILPNLNLKYSNIDTIFIPSDRKEMRSKILRKLSEEDENSKYGGKVMGGREGLFIEKPDIIDKYCRRIITEDHIQLQDLSLVQFAKMYQPIRRKRHSTEDDIIKRNDLHSEDNTADKQGNVTWKSEENPSYNNELLPKSIELDT